MRRDDSGHRRACERSGTAVGRRSIAHCVCGGTMQVATNEIEIKSADGTKLGNEPDSKHQILLLLFLLALGRGCTHHVVAELTLRMALDGCGAVQRQRLQEIGQ